MTEINDKTVRDFCTSVSENEDSAFELETGKNLILKITKEKIIYRQKMACQIW